MKKVFLSLLSVLALPLLADVSITPVYLTFTKTGGTGTVSTAGDGDWAASADLSWVQLTITSGTAGDACKYTVTPNKTCETRSGVISIANQTHTVYQAGQSATVTPKTVEVPYATCSQTFTVTTADDATWTATTEADWVECSGSTALTGSGAVTYNVSENTTLNPRTCTIRIAGKNITLIQQAPDILLNTSAIFSSSDETEKKIVVSALETTEWNAVSSADWAVVENGTGRTGEGVVTVNICENMSVLTRTASIQIGTKTVTITQAGQTSAMFYTDPSARTNNYTRASGMFDVLGTLDVNWFSTNTVDWLSITYGQTGNGNGSVGFIVDRNPTLYEREGEITVTPVDAPSIADESYSGTDRYVKFPFDGSLLGIDGKTGTAKDYGATISGMESRTDRFGNSARGYATSEDGKITLSDFGSLFEGENVYDTLEYISHYSHATWEFSGSKSTSSGTHTHYWAYAKWDGHAMYGSYISEFLYSYDRYYYQTDCNWTTVHTTAKQPYWNGCNDATYVLWIKIAAYPSKTANILERIVSSSCSDVASANAVLKLCLLQDGKLQLQQAEQIIDSTKTVPINQWLQLAFVGVDKTSITVKINGEDFISTTSNLSFANLPDGDNRAVNSYYCSDDACYLMNKCKTAYRSYNSYGYSDSGSIINTKIQMNIGGWNGAIDDMTFYNTALDDQHISQMYEKGKSPEAHFVVTQKASVPTASTNELYFGAEMAEKDITITLPDYVEWTYENDNDWITVATESAPKGTQTVRVVADDNMIAENREAYITIADIEIHILQEAAPLALSTTKLTAPTDGYDGEVSVECDDGIVWTTLSQAAWIKIFSEMVTVGPGTIELLVDELPSDRNYRIGYVSVGENMLKVIQSRDGTSSPLPDLGTSPSSADIEDVMSEAADLRLKERINTASEYDSYKTWANKISNKSSQKMQAIQDSQHSWISYALDTPDLIIKDIGEGDVSVEKFEPTSTDGAFDFTVKVKDITIGSDATSENLKKVFGLEGGTSLTDMSSDNVSITFDTPSDGKVKFTAGPKDTNEGTFFMRVKMTP